jgi:SAM-dependent methyltransferase
MSRQAQQDNDWHRNFQDEDYLHLSLERLKDNCPPLHWCVQFADIIRDHFQGSAGSLSIHDIGCNVGHFCRVLPELQHEVTYRGYDISETYLGLARERHPQHTFTLVDIATEQPYQEADVSIISATLEHIEPWESALSNILTSTRQLVLLRCFFGMQPASDMYKKAQASYPYLIRQFTFEQIASTAESKGFSTRFLRDYATDSIPQYLGCGVTRTQYIAVLRKDQKST